jgi:hypothetical protein
VPRRRIIFDEETDNLLFDRDGTGGAAKFQLAIIGTNLALAFADVLVS